MKNYKNLSVAVFVLLVNLLTVNFVSAGTEPCVPGYIQGNVPTAQIPDYNYTAEGLLEFHFYLTDASWKFNYFANKNYDANCNLIPGPLAMYADRQSFVWPGVKHLLLRYEELSPGQYTPQAYDGDTGVKLIFKDQNSPFGTLTRMSSGGNRSPRLIFGNGLIGDLSNNLERGDLISTPAVPIKITPTKTPVVIIPGILSSYLNRNDDEKTEVWMNLAKAFTSPTDDYLDELGLDQLGRPDMQYPIMLPTDVPRKVSVPNLVEKDFFDGLIKKLTTNGYTEGEDLFVFPYDWRLNIVDSVSGTYTDKVISLKDKIDQILIQTKSDKVDIVAHSMGGLLSKYYISNFGADKVRKFVDIATPHLGAPSAFQALMYGDDVNIKLGFLGLNSQKIKEISQNMPSSYQLLPSRKYFSADLSDYQYYVNDMDDFDNDGVKGKLTFDQTKKLLKNSGRNDLLLDIVPNIHNDLDNMNPADYGVKAYNIIGCATPTIGKFFLLNKQNTNDPQYDIAYISGDGTVPQRSAEEFPSLKKYYAHGMTHATMPSTSGIKELVSAILSGQENSFDFDVHSNMSVDSTNCKLPNGTFIAFHSPVNLDIYDSLGRHAGPDENGEIEQNIQGLAYDVIENNKFAFIPDGTNYDIKLQATDTGSFSSHIKRIENGQVVSTAYFADIPLASTSTRAKVNISSIPSIAMDEMGDGIFEETIVPTKVVAGDMSDDRIVPEFILGLDSSVFKLNISGLDNLSSTTIDYVDGSNSSRLYTIIDQAGNTNRLNIQTNSESVTKLDYTLSFPDIPSSINASLVFQKSLDRDGNLKTLSQTIKQGRDAIIYTYTVGQNKTVINTRDGKERNRQVYAEDKIIEFITNHGLIEIK